jgi:hypothetical protein
MSKAMTAYQRGNLLAAASIMASPDLYPPDSLPATWASRVLSRAVALPEDRKAGPLFAGKLA